MIVYLWDAGRWCGVSGSLETAQGAAAARMGESSARVEEARPVNSTRGLMRTYERTGRTWTARGGGTWIEQGARSESAWRESAWRGEVAMSTEDAVSKWFTLAAAWMQANPDGSLEDLLAAVPDTLGVVRVLDGPPLDAAAVYREIAGACERGR